MMADILENSGLYFDELNRIRVLDPQVTNKIIELKEQCKLFVGRTDQFQKTSEDFILTVSNLAEEVEKQKIKALGIRNLLQLMSKHEDLQEEQFQAIIFEKAAELERQKNRLNSLQKTEMGQLEVINNLSNY